MTSNKSRILYAFALVLISISFTGAQVIKSGNQKNKNFDVLNYTIRVKFDRESKIVYGDTTVELKPTTNNIQTVELDAGNLKFNSVKLESDNKNLDYKETLNKVIVALDKTYSINDSIKIRFNYSTKPKKGIYFVDALEQNGEIIRAAQIWTQGETEEAHFWFPCYDFPDDKATSELYITVEKGETAIGNGELINTITNADGTKTFHFKISVPHSTYLTSFVVGTYKKISDNYKDIPLGYYVYPDQTALAKTAYGKTKQMMQIFEDLTQVKYPYNKYDQTMVAEFQFGGMENITATTMADTEIMFSQFSFGKEIVDDLVSHELAHSWFGNLVTCRNWSELWLNEGFATFMEAAFREKANNREDYIRKIHDDASQFMIADARSKKRPPLYNSKADPLTVFDEPEFIYQKGGVVLHMLRETVGTDNFWKAVNIYLNRHKFDNAETSDLQSAMEETSGQNLDIFFKQWVYGAGFPHLRVDKQYDAKTKTFNITVTQVHKITANVPSAFHFPLDVELITSKGIIKETFDISKRVQSFSVKTGSAPSRVIFDKNEKIPLKLLKY